MPDAARISDNHTCPIPGHGGGPIFSGSSNVIVGFLPAARIGDAVICLPVGPVDKIAVGSATVVINHRSAARKTDPCIHGSIIVAGCPTVIIGDSPQSFTFRAAAVRGTPLCEECERKRREVMDRELKEEPGPPEPDTATLDDDAPPPGARAGVDHLAAATEDQEALARQPDAGDGLDEQRLLARMNVAFAFLASSKAGKLKPSKVMSHIRGIDLGQPVEVVSVASKTLYQRGMPNLGNGQYFSFEAGIKPEDLGASEMVYPIVDNTPTPPAVPRDKRTIAFDDKPAKGLKSTAGPIDDTWSMKGTAVPCPGGAAQVMVPKTFHGGTTTTIH